MQDNVTGVADVGSGAGLHPRLGPAGAGAGARPDGGGGGVAIGTEWVALAVSLVALFLTGLGVRYQCRTHRDTTRRAKQTTIAVYYTLERIMQRVSHTPLLGYDWNEPSCETHVSDHFLAPGRSVELKLEWRFGEEQLENMISCDIVSPSGSISTVSVDNAETITLRYPEDFPKGSTGELGPYEVRWHGKGTEDLFLGVTSFLVGPFE